MGYVIVLDIEISLVYEWQGKLYPRRSESVDLKLHRIMETDVLIVGGGAAGLRAAIAACGEDRRVTILAQFKVGYANNSAISLGGVSAAAVHQAGEDSPQRHYEDTITGGCFLNRPFLVRTLTDHVPSEVRSLEEMGVQFQRDDAGNYIRVARGGHTLARRLATPTNTGMELLTPLLKYAEGLNIQRLEDLQVVQLVKKDRQISGVLVVDQEGEWFVVSAKSVVLATGGCGALYPQTTNVPDAIGNGYALAYDAGLVLQDMEFVQFVIRNVPAPDVPRRLPPHEFLLIKGAKLRNDRGEDLLPSNGTTRSFTRDIITRVVARELMRRQAEGGYVYVDLRPMPQEEISRIGPLETYALKVVPASHFFMGGIRVDENFCTGINGLYAAGEVVGGVHGANRLAGNALAETCVFGSLTGALAARFSDQCGVKHLFNMDQAHDAFDRMMERFSRNREGRLADANFPALQTELKNMTGECAGAVRNRAKIEEGLSRLATLRDTVGGFPLARPQDYWPFLTCHTRLSVSEMILKSALKREESRGAHFREDFPGQDDEQWRVNICVRQGDNEGMRLTVEPVQ
jgi:succinate dehydrogenase/fumarate reductase flavoprotein subunit